MNVAIYKILKLAINIYDNACLCFFFFFLSVMKDIIWWTCIWYSIFATFTMIKVCNWSLG